MADHEPDGAFQAALAADDVEFWGDEGEQQSLVDLINRVLDRGVVVSGEVMISVAGVDLVYLGLNAILTSVSTARRKIAAAGEAAESRGTVRPGAADEG